MVSPCTEFEAGKYAAPLWVARPSVLVGRYMSLLSINMMIPQGSGRPCEGVRSAKEERSLIGLS